MLGRSATVPAILVCLPDAWPSPMLVRFASEPPALPEASFELPRIVAVPAILVAVPMWSAAAAPARIALLS